MKKQPRRDWTEARAKVAMERRCRVCVLARRDLSESFDVLDTFEFYGFHAAHIIGRELDKKDGYKVLPERIVPMCPEHHRRYDPHTRGNDEPVDIWGLLTIEEQGQAVEDAGGFWLAVKRCAPVAYREFNERKVAV